MDAELAEVLNGIGPRLRALRRDRGLTLEALAADTGISVSTLSRLETGNRGPSLELLIPLARAHHVALDQLVAAPATGDPRVHLRPLRRKKKGSVVVPLTQYPGRVQVFKEVLAPRKPKLVTHHGYEWLYVLAGELRLILGEREFTLRPGEVAEFDTSEPHWFGPADLNAVEILHLFGPHGDHAVIRTGPSATSRPAPLPWPMPVPWPMPESTANEPMLTERFQRAFGMASEIHALQLRKGTGIPYLSHLMSVAALVLEHGGDEDDAISGLLHDAIEDSDDGARTEARIRSELGDRVADAVVGCSDAVAVPGEVKAPWGERKERYIRHLADEADPRVLLVSACDKLHNARSIVADLRSIGPALWERFSQQDPAEHLWYYQSLADCYAGRVPEGLTAELNRVLADLRALVNGSGSLHA